MEMIMFDFDMPPLDWRVCRIPKPRKPGEYRKITIPNDELKAVQGTILRFLYKQEGLRPSAFAHGFVPFRNTSTSVARIDRLSRAILCMDVKDFFDNFPLDPIYDRMIEAGLGECLVDKILTVCSYRGTIPQGGPCSPCLTNIGMFETDLALSSFAASRGLVYGRYADDIVLSVESAYEDEAFKLNPVKIFYGVDKLLRSRLGLRLKPCKNHVVWRDSRCKRQVLGVTIRKDGKGYNAPVAMRRMVRAMLCNLAHKVQGNNGVVVPEDWQTWGKITGYVRYFDNLRSYGDGDAASSDPIVQERYWNYLVNKFKRKKRKR